MRFAHIVNEVWQRPWLITPQMHATIRQVVAARLAGHQASLEDLLEPDDAPDMVNDEGVAIIPVRGVILKGASKIEKACGAVGVEDISANLQAAAADDEVSGIMLDVDSPGGTVGGVPELGDLVAEISQVKPTMAYTDGLMASAAYWLAAGAQEIYAARSAEVGSIGVYVPWVDESAAFAAQGVKVDIIRNEGADLKGMGYPGTALTPEQRQSMQDEVNALADEFHAHIESCRGKMEADTFRGQTFLAMEAKRRCLIDGVMSRSAALAQFRDQVT
jgi:signal peptide peptidase SppA